MGDGARRLLQLAGQLKSDRNRQFAESGLLGLFQDDCDLNPVADLYMRGDGPRQFFFDAMEHY